MTHIRGYHYRRRGKLIRVPGHERRVYKGYRAGRRSFMHDQKRRAKYRPAKHYKRHLGHRGDW